MAWEGGVSVKLSGVNAVCCHGAVTKTRGLMRQTHIFAAILVFRRPVLDMGDMATLNDIPELYILRHGETEWNAEGRMQGALNSPLTPKGEMDAARQGEILRSRNLDGFVFICSPQGRAFQTAGIALARIARDIRTDDRLREISVGEWSGELRRELKVSVPLHDGPDGPLALYENAPGGEGFAGLEQRCLSFLADLQGPAVLVTHGITSRMIRSLILTGGPDAMARVEGGQGNVFHLHDGQQKLLE